MQKRTYQIEFDAPEDKAWLVEYLRTLEDSTELAEKVSEDKLEEEDIFSLNAIMSTMTSFSTKKPQFSQKFSK